MTVRELCDRLLGIDGDMEVLIRAGDDDNFIVCGIRAVGVESGCTDTDMLMIDGDAEGEEDDG